MAKSDLPPRCIIGYGSSPPRCGPRQLVGGGTSRFPRNELPHMPGSSTTPDRPGTRAHAPGRIAFHLRNSVGARIRIFTGLNGWPMCSPANASLPILTNDHAWLGADVDRYSFTMSDLHRLLVAGLPPHCEKLWTLPAEILARPQPDRAALQQIQSVPAQRSSTDRARALPSNPLVRAATQAPRMCQLLQACRLCCHLNGNRF